MVCCLQVKHRGKTNSGGLLFTSEAEEHQNSGGLLFTGEAQEYNNSGCLLFTGEAQEYKNSACGLQVKHRSIPAYKKC